MRKLVAIHQPNFFPWLGYFDKIRRADAFIVLDNVQQQKTGGTWSNRVMLNVGGQAKWVTAPVDRTYAGVRAVNQIEFDEQGPWRDKILKTLHANYRKASHFNAAIDLLEPVLLCAERRMWAYNVNAVHALLRALDMPAAELVLASMLPAQGTATELLISLVRAVGGDTYLSGGGATTYQDESLFLQAGVGLVFQNFQHPVYPQHGVSQFIPGLSIIDALMNCGIAGTRDLLQSVP